MILQKVAKPDHVPADLVRDFDFHRVPGFETDMHFAWKRVLDENPDIFWSPYYGGTWVMTRAEDAQRSQIDHELFSMSVQAIPRNITPSLPIEVDPPEHGPMRAILNPLFAPMVIRRLENVARTTAIDLIEGFKAQGRCEFIADFSRQLPIKLFLHMVDLPDSDRAQLLSWGDVRARGSTSEEREAAKQKLLVYLESVIRERMENPRDDVLSKVMHGKINGEPIPFQMMRSLLVTVMFAGLDTVASILGFIARHLAQHAELRHLLAASPNLIPAAVDELVRRYPVQVGGRIIMHDVNYKGVEFRKGDRVMVPTMTANLDERLFPDPMTFDIDRPNKAKAHTFGGGPHRCPGANLGKAEIRIFIEEWLKRIPDFSLDPNDPPVFAGGLISSVLRLPLVW